MAIAEVLQPPGAEIASLPAIALPPNETSAKNELLQHGDHWVAVVGGAVAGTEVASRLAQKGINVLVIEQNYDPFGKIKRGLPFWHDDQQEQEEQSILEDLTGRGIHVLFNTRVGNEEGEVSIAQLEELGVSKIVIAAGAEKDRPLTFPAAEDYLGHGLRYQNEFIQSMNEFYEKHLADAGGIDWRQFKVADNTLVPGGGLASVDVVKGVMLIRTAQALQDRGITVDIVEMEHKGIPDILQRYNMTIEELDIVPPTLLYRKTKAEMSLGPDIKDPEKRKRINERMLDTAQNKYLFKFREDTEVVDLEGNETGVQTAILETKERDKEGKIIGTKRERQATTAVISAIGSIVNQVGGLPMDARGERYDLEDDTMTFAHSNTLYAAGNTATLKGNIRTSRIHAQAVEQTVSTSLDKEIEALATEVLQMPAPDTQHQEHLRSFVKSRHDAIWYGGSIYQWIADRNVYLDQGFDLPED